MSSIVWNKFNLESSLGRIFLNCVLNNMVSKESKVRFGITGKGIHPNYQVIDSKGFINTYNGRSHKKHKVDEFSQKNLSDVFDKEVIYLIAQ